jgi:hypothetical protein
MQNQVRTSAWVTLRKLNWILLVAGFVLVVGSILAEGDFSLGVFAIPFVGFFIAVGFVPYVPLGTLNGRLRKPGALALLSVGLIGLSAFWIWAFGSVFWWNPTPDAQDGLAVLVIPAAMVIGAAPVALAAWLVERYL